jgi:hypothetical protein
MERRLASDEAKRMKQSQAGDGCRLGSPGIN